MLIYCLFFIVAIIAVIFWLWMLIDALSRKNYDTENEKLLWCIIILLGNWIGGILYFFLVKKKKDKETPKPPAAM